MLPLGHWFAHIVQVNGITRWKLAPLPAISVTSLVVGEVISTVAFSVGDLADTLEAFFAGLVVMAASYGTFLLLISRAHIHASTMASDSRAGVVKSVACRYMALCCIGERTKPPGFAAVGGSPTYALTKLKYAKNGRARQICRRGTPCGCPLCKYTNQEMRISLSCRRNHRAKVINRATARVAPTRHTFT